MDLKGIINSPSKFPLENTFSSLLFMIFGKKILVTLLKSLMSFFENAISALFNKKSSVKNDFIGKNKSSLNILASIKESKKRRFSNLLFGLGIRFVGKTISEKLTEHFQEIDKLINASYEEIISVDEIGDKIAESLIYHFSQKENINIINNLKVFGLKLREDKKTNSKKSYKLNNMVFVVSGKFLNFSREQIHEEIKNNGGKVSKSLSSKTNYLVSGEKIGPMKKIKADKLKISIITEDEFMRMI